MPRIVDLDGLSSEPWFAAGRASLGAWIGTADERDLADYKEIFSHTDLGRMSDLELKRRARLEED